MKKALAEVVSQQGNSDLVARLDKIEARLEKLDPTPKPETIEPYAVGSSVYSIVDLEARNPFVVSGYERGTGRILVLMPGEESPRSMPLDSVRPLEQCPRATPTPSQLYAHMDTESRDYWAARRKAEIESKTKPFTPPLREQDRYSDRDPIESQRRLL